MNCKNNVDLVTQREFTKIKRIAKIEISGDIYCFSCEDVKGYLKTRVPTITLANGEKKTLTDEDRTYLENFLRENNCDEDSEDESEEVSVITEKATEPYIENLGILDKAKKFSVPHRYYMGYGEEIKIGNLLQYVKKHTRDFFENINQPIPSSLDFNSIQNSRKTSNIFEAAIEYYKRIYEYLENKDLLDEYASFSNENRKIIVEIDDVSTDVTEMNNRFFGEPVYNAKKGLINMSNLSITSIRNTFFPDNVEKIHLDSNKLTNLEGVILPRNLKELSLSVNKITKLPTQENFFPPTLLKLDLLLNTITNLNLVHFPSSITNLILSNNNLNNLNGVVFPRNLIFLNLTQNSISLLDDMNLPSSIQSLFISNNKLKNLNRSILPSSLKILYLDDNLIENIDNFEFPELIKNINLNRNKIEYIKNVKFPPDLIRLDLSKNNLKSIENVTFPSSLEFLTIEHNDIDYIPEHIMSLKKLKEFYYDKKTYLNSSKNVKKFIKTIKYH